MATAYVAVHAVPGATRVLDLGCGIGSVLLHVAWCLPTASLVGIEAQDVSFVLLAENVRRNGLGDRVTIHRGDLRERAQELGGPFDLVTGTPPYFPRETAVKAMDEQRRYARIEYRGGLEAYVLAGSAALSHDGTLVLCGDARAESRLRSAADLASLSVNARTSIVAHAPEPPLFAVWTLARHPRRFVDSTIVLRDREARSTPDAARLKAFSGLGG